jgi:hypothetical protein
MPCVNGVPGRQPRGFPGPAIPALRAERPGRGRAWSLLVLDHGWRKHGTDVAQQSSPCQLHRDPTSHPRRDWGVSNATMLSTCRDAASETRSLPPRYRVDNVESTTCSRVARYCVESQLVGGGQALNQAKLGLYDRQEPAEARHSCHSFRAH